MKDIIALLRFVKSYWHLAALSILLTIFSVIFGLFSYTMVIPFLQILFDNTERVTEMVEWSLTIEALQHNFYYYLSEFIVNKGELAALMFVSVVVIIASFFKNGFLYFSRFFVVPMRNGVAFDLQQKVINKILNLPIGYFSDERKGDIITRFSNDIHQIKLSVNENITMLIKDPITIAISLVYLFSSNYQLTLIVLVCLPLIGFLIGRVGRSLKRKSIRGQKMLGNLVSEIEETITGLRIIKAFTAEKKVTDKFSISNKNFRLLMNKIERIVTLSNPLSEFLGTVVVVFIMYFGGTLILGENGNFSSEEFIAYLVVFSQILTPAKSITSSYYNIRKASGSITRINELINIEEKIIEIDNPIEIKEFKNNIEFKNVSFKYDEKYVLDNINLKIEKGKTIALVGESGSGKSTLVDLIPRFYDIQEGEILIDGINIKNLKLKSLRELMGNVNQVSILFNDTIENNIAFGLENYRIEEVVTASKIANAYEFIQEKPDKFQTNIGESGSKLSGGQKQRISIARAVMKNPPILILDEATSALDTESEKIVQDALDNLMKNRTTIVIAHRLSTVKNADEICVLNQGKIVERGKHNDLIEKNGIYKRLCDLQMF